MKTGLKILIVIFFVTVIAGGCTGVSVHEPENGQQEAANTGSEVDQQEVSNPGSGDDQQDLLSSESAQNETPDNTAGHESFESDIRDAIISGEEAREIFEENDNVILLDVRNQDEFDEFNIPSSTLIPLDDLEHRLSELPDKDAIIIVFCRAGRRSAIAMDLLISNGYVNIYNMQSINNWDE